MGGSGGCSSFPRALLHLQKRLWFWGIQESRDVDVEEQDDDGGNRLSSEYNTEPRDVFILVVCIIYALQTCNKAKTTTNNWLPISMCCCI